MRDAAYYESMGGMTRLDVINEAEERLIAQGEFCYDEQSGQCNYGRYDADKDRETHCAIGILPGFPTFLGNAGGSAQGLYRRFSEVRTMFAPDVTGDFLTYVQSRLHDSLVEAQELAKTELAKTAEQPKVEFVFADAIRTAAATLRKEIAPYV